MKKNFWYIPEVNKVCFRCTEDNHKKILFLKPDKIWKMKWDGTILEIELLDKKVYQVKSSVRSIVSENTKYGLTFFEAKRGLIMNFKYITEAEIGESRVYLTLARPKDSNEILTILNKRWSKIKKQFGIQIAGN